MEKLEDENSSQPSLHFSKALEGVSQFPLMQALGGRRSRRFCMGAEIPDGPLAFKSSQKPLPLTELEQISQKRVVIKEEKRRRRSGQLRVLTPLLLCLSSMDGIHRHNHRFLHFQKSR